MNNRQRFQETMGYGRPDRVPCFGEGIRSDVLDEWCRQGLPSTEAFRELFPTDRREDLPVDLLPRPKLEQWPSSVNELEVLRRCFDPDDPKRLPDDWSKRVSAWKNRDHVLMMWVHRGFFLSMGVGDWKRFNQVIYLLSDNPDFVRETLAIQGEFAARLTERVLKEVEIDAVIFSEPIGGNDRPLISPRMYEEFVLTSYEPVRDVLYKYGVKTIIFQTYANARVLIPSILKWGFNCLWASEVNSEAMDYADLRREFGKDLRLIGGIDLDALRLGKDYIRREFEEKALPLMAEGGYVPLAGGRVRPEISLENYTYYRRLLEKITRGETLSD